MPTTAYKNVDMTGECERNRRTNTTFEEKRVNPERKKEGKKRLCTDKFCQKTETFRKWEIGGKRLRTSERTSKFGLELEKERKSCRGFPTIFDPQQANTELFTSTFQCSI